jgi:hypothetical protein
MLSLYVFLIASTMPLPESEASPAMPLVAIRPEDIKLPPPKEATPNPGPPRKRYWPSPNRRFTRKG